MLDAGNVAIDRSINENNFAPLKLLDLLRKPSGRRDSTQIFVSADAESAILIPACMLHASRPGDEARA